MDSRDNRQHRIRHQQVVPSYSGAVAPIYSGVDSMYYTRKLYIFFRHSHLFPEGNVRRSV